MDVEKTVLDETRRLLDTHGVAYREVHHEPTFTSEESAKARGEDMKIGGKALLMKVGKTFRLFVISAPKKVDSAKIRAHFGERKLRFATKEELLEYTGLVPGSVPPFGEPIVRFSLHVDPSVLENEMIAFNAGSLTDSIVMRVDDWRRVAQPEVADFSVN